MIKAQPKEITPQLLRLFFWAGVVDRQAVEAIAAKHDSYKTIVDVMRQDVSLETFRNLLTADLLFMRKRTPKFEEELHKGLSGPGVVNDHEIVQLIEANDPPLAGIVQALKDDKVIDADVAARIEQELNGNGTIKADVLRAQRLLPADVIGPWLGRPESRQMRRAALLMSLHFLAFNQAIDPAEAQTLAQRVRAGELEQVARRLQQVPQLKGSDLQDFVERDFKYPAVELGPFGIDPAMFAIAPESMLRRHLFLPFQREAEAFSIASNDPLNVALVALLEWTTGRWPQTYFAPAGDIIAKINGHFSPQRPPETAVFPAPQPMRSAAAPAAIHPPRETSGVADNVSAVQLVTSIIEGAIDLRTTDIHLEPIREGLAVRFRIDGELRRIMTVPLAMAQPVASRIKVLAEMDVTERRRPQDGHFELNLGNRNFDFRISTLPAMQGEKVVIRILDSARVVTSMRELGMLPDQESAFEWMLERPYGMILVTGPTGSGKTSTLYSGLHRLNVPTRNLVTVEDPVEYQLEGITQVQVDANNGLTFADGLRSILRQDPDVIMVGEIRDAETAQIAIRAAMTGHVVLSTLHTNTALGSIDALMHLGIIRFMLASSLVGIISQRLMRVLCEHCKKSMKITPELRAELGIPEDKRKSIRRPAGCEECLKGGYLGRTGVFEVIRVTDQLRPLLGEKHRLEDIERAAREAGMMSLQQAALEKLLAGVTSVDEVRRKILIDI